MGLYSRRRRGRKRKIIMVKLSSLFMEQIRSRQRGAIARNRKRKREGINGNLCADMPNPTNNAGIDNLSDDLLVNILSRMSLKEAARTSALSRRWRYLWRLLFGTLRFDFTGDASDTAELEKFESWVNNVLELHQGPYIEGIVISFEEMRVHDPVSPRMSRVIDKWVYSAVQKEVRRFELNLSHKYEFPSIEMLVSHSHGMSKTSPFLSLRTLRLFEVEIKDEVVHYFLASCPNLEELCIDFSNVTKNLQVVDPPSLRFLEIRRCVQFQSLELSAAKLVSLAYGGRRTDSLPKNIPNLRELSISGGLYSSFVNEPKEHSFYSDQLVKLVVELQLPNMGYIHGSVVTPYLGLLSSLRQLEVQAFSIVGRSLLFFTSMIKASPQLCEFRIEMSYPVYGLSYHHEWLAFPEITVEEAVKFNHRSLKVVEMRGYVGCSSEEGLLREVLENAPLIERVGIDTKSGYYDDPDWVYVRNYERNIGRFYRERGTTTRAESKQRAYNLVSTLPHQQIHFIVT